MEVKYRIKSQQNSLFSRPLWLVSGLLFHIPEVDVRHQPDPVRADLWSGYGTGGQCFWFDIFSIPALVPHSSAPICLHKLHYSSVSATPGVGHMSRYQCEVLVFRWTWSCWGCSVPCCLTSSARWRTNTPASPCCGSWAVSSPYSWHLTFVHPPSTGINGQAVR